MMSNKVLTFWEFIESTSNFFSRIYSGKKRLRVFDLRKDDFFSPGATIIKPIIFYLLFFPLSVFFLASFSVRARPPLFFCYSSVINPSLRYPIITLSFSNPEWRAQDDNVINN